YAGHAGAGRSFVTPAAMPCGKVSVRALLVVTPNPNTTASTIRFRVTVHGAAGPAVVRTIAVIQAPGDPPPPPVPALTVSSTSLPGGAVGAPYAATLAATGGSPPYVWSVASGSLPPGLTLSSPGALTGTPTLAGQWSVGLRIQDAAGRTAAATFAIAISAPAPSPPPTTPTYASGNWSGYMALGGPYTGVTGTFNVPQLYAGTL